MTFLTHNTLAAARRGEALHFPFYYCIARAILTGARGAPRRIPHSS